MIVEGRTAIPIQVTWDAQKDPNQRALDGFYNAHPDAGEAVFVTADAFQEPLDALPNGSGPACKTPQRVGRINYKKQ